MIEDKYIEQLVLEKIKGTEKFLVSVKVKPSNKIEVLLDSLQLMNISDCIEVSKFIESQLDREKEDFELTVSSAGIDEPFKVDKQYLKNVGREVLITNKDGEKFAGKLNGINALNEVEILVKKREPKEKGKGMVNVIENLTIPLSQIKETKLVLSFK